MNKKTEGFLSGMTVVGLVLVSFVVFVSIALCIMLATGYFNKRTEPLVGLAFDTTETVVIAENGGKINLTVLGLDETGETKYTVPADVKLTVRNTSNVADDTIISVPEIIKTGEEFEVEAILDELDNFNVGGTCYIYAETVDQIYRVATPLKVCVDVPVSEVSITATNPNNNEPLDLETAKFIYDDRVQLKANVVPERAQYVYGDTTQKKTIRFTSDNTDNASVDFNTGLVEVEYNPNYISDEELTEPLDYASITVNVNTYASALETQMVSNTCQLGLYPLQLGKIIIQNEDFDNVNDKFSTKLFSANTLKLSAEETGVDGVINLNVFLEPVIYNPDNNPNPISDLFGFTMKCYSSNQAEPLNIITEHVVDYLGRRVSYWEIDPVKLKQTGETLQVVMNIDGHSEQLAISRELNIYAETPESFHFENDEGIELSHSDGVKLEITKYDDASQPNVLTPTNVHYVYTDANEPSFTKFVFFLGSNANKNEVGSQIILADDTTRQITTTLSDTLIINPCGAGTVEIVPYLVVTNKSGQPIDKDGKIIVTGKDAQELGVNEVLATGICDYNSEAALSGEYLRYKAYSSLPVKVSEKLTQLTLYKDANLTEELLSSDTNPYILGTTFANAIEIFAKPNSALALPEDPVYYSEFIKQYGAIKFVEGVKKNPGDCVFTLPDLTTSASATNFQSIGTKGSETYKRCMYFKIQANSPIEKETVSIRYNTADETVSAVTTLYLNSIDVPISGIEIDKIFNKDVTYELKEWKFDMKVSSETITYNKMNYARVTYSDNGGQIVLPRAKFYISEEHEALGIKSPTSTKDETEFYVFDTTVTAMINGTERSLLEILSLAYNLTPADENYAYAWAYIKENLLTTANKELARDYIAKTNTANGLGHTLNIKKALPANYQAFMFYRAVENDAVVSIDQVKPDMVMLKYAWPEVVTTKLISLDETEENITTIDNVKYYNISQADGASVRSFLYESVLLSNISYVDSVGAIQEVNINNVYSITTDNNLSYKVELAEEEGQLNQLIFSVNTLASIPDGQVLTATIKKDFKFILDWNLDDATWDSMVQENNANGQISTEAYIQHLANNLTTSANIPDETVNFIVKAENQNSI